MSTHFSEEGSLNYRVLNCSVVDSSWNMIAHGDAREGKWRGNCRMEWVFSTFHTTSEHGVSSTTNADAQTSAARSRLNWRPADLNALVRFNKRRNLVSAHVTSHFNLPLHSAASQAIAFWHLRGTHTSACLIKILCDIWLHARSKLLLLSFSQGATVSSRPRPPRCRGFTIALRHTHLTR